LFLEFVGNLSSDAIPMSKKKKGNKRKQSKKKSPKRGSKKKVGKKSLNKLEPTRQLDDFWFNKNLHLFLVFAISFGIYINTFWNKYAVDDSIVILRNEFTKKGLNGMKGIWGEDTFTGFFGSKRNLVEGGRYRPLSLATFALELQFLGEVVKDANGQPILDKDGDVNYKGDPMVSHVINVLLYAILCVVIYLMLLQMFNPREEQDNIKGYFIALAGAILYATHPIHTEAVANIKGRDEIMVLLGAVLATYWVLKAFAKEGSERALLLVGAMVAFVFSIFSKENAVTFLAIIPMAMYFFTPASIAQIAIYSAPFLVISLGFWFGVRAPVLGEAGAIGTSGDGAPAMELMNNPFLKIENNRYVPYTFAEEKGTVLYTWIEYIRLLLFPHPLTNDYYPKHIRTIEDIIPNFQHPQVVLSIFLHLAMAILTIWGILKKKKFAFFLIFYAATFSVVSNWIFPIGTNMAERFMFLPSVGFSALCAMGLFYWIERSVRNKGDWEAGMKIPLAVLTIVVVLYSAKTFSRNFAWYSDYTLFTTDIETSPNSAKLNNAVSGVLQDKSKRVKDPLRRKTMLQDALKHSVRATNMHPTYNNAWLLQGNANVMLGNMSEREGGRSQDPNTRNRLFGEALTYFNNGLACYKQVKRLRPNHPDIKRNFGVVYRDRGKLLGQRLGQIDASIQSLERSLEYTERDLETFRLLGVALGMRGMQLQQQGLLEAATQSHLKAIEYFNKALEMNPNNVPILYNLEVAYRVLNQPEKVEEYRKRWMEIDPDYNPKNQQ